MEMNKLEALRYFMTNYQGSDGGYTFAVIREMIEEDKDSYTEEELDMLIKECEEW